MSRPRKPTDYLEYQRAMYLGLPGWVDRAVRALAMAYGEEPARRDDSELRIGEDQKNSIEDCDGNIVVRFSEQLNADEARTYACLFVAASELLGCIESIVSAEAREYRSADEPSNGNQSPLPERVARLYSLIAAAKGARPLRTLRDSDP